MFRVKRKVPEADAEKHLPGLRAYAKEHYRPKEP